MSQRAYERSTAIDFLSSWSATATQTYPPWTSAQWPHATHAGHMLSICYPRCPHAHPVHRCKYLIPHDMTMGQLVYVLRKRIAVPAEQAIFVFVGNTLPPATALVSNVVRAAPALAR